MAKKRKAIAYRSIERPYTRHSKYREKNFVRGKPQVKIVHFNQGNKVRTDFPVRLSIISEQALQIRDIALESARQACNRSLEANIEKGKYVLHIKVYPHHILRERSMAAQAGADRMSKGMSKSYGKTTGRAAQIKVGQVLITVETEEKFTAAAKRGLKLACHKFPKNYHITTEKVAAVAVKVPKAAVKAPEVKAQ